MEIVLGLKKQKDAIIEARNKDSGENNNPDTAMSHYTAQANSYMRNATSGMKMPAGVKMPSMPHL